MGIIGPQCCQALSMAEFYERADELGLVELRRVKKGLEEVIFYIISHTTASAGFILACSGTRLRAGACSLLGAAGPGTATAYSPVSPSTGVAATSSPLRGDRGHPQ